MGRVTVALVAVLGLAPAALASHPSWLFERPANLDGDRGRERIVAEYDVSSDHKSERAEIAAVDRCGGRDRRYELVPPGRFMNREDIRGDRVLGRPGALVSMVYRDGHSIARVVQLRRSARASCPRPGVLFSYSTRTPPQPPPGKFVLARFEVDVRDEAARFPGKELVLSEYYSELPGSPLRSVRQTYYRYRAAVRRYVVYKTALRPA
jgi:hypothetical protein